MSSYKPNNAPKATSNNDSRIPKYTSTLNKSTKLNEIRRKSLSRSIDDINEEPTIKISNIIGDFGPYQIAVVLFSALRAMCCSMDGLSSPFLSPKVEYRRCEDCNTYNSSSFMPPYTLNGELANTSNKNRCFLTLNNATRYEIDQTQCEFKNLDQSATINNNVFLNCKKWSFDLPGNEDLMTTLTIEQSLVCDREWLKSFSNSMYYVGATLGLLFWGFISDRYGRKTAYVCSHFITLIFGFSALFAQDMTTFVILRSINAFGMIGELIPRSIQVEIVAAEYRYICSVICQTGWATGIILVPALSYMNPSYRFILSIPVIVSALMLPWLYFLPESARWLIINNKYQRARNELLRAAKINNKFRVDSTDLMIERFNNQVLREEVDSGASAARMGIWKSMLAIFTNVQLLKNTISVFLLLFVAEVVYFSLTLNVADLGGSLHVNYIISGFSEFISIALCGTLLAYLSRRMCLSVLLLASTVSYLMMAIVNVYEESLSMTFILGVNAFGKITAIGNLMVIILVSQEVFPTVIRQFGTSLCITVGKAGSAVAPFTHELGQIIGQSYCFTMFSLICFSCAFVPIIGLSETGKCELADTVVDIESSNKKKEQKSKLAANGKVFTYQIANHQNDDDIKKISSEDLNNNSNGLNYYKIDQDFSTQYDDDNNNDNFQHSPDKDMNSKNSNVQDNLKHQSSRI